MSGKGKKEWKGKGKVWHDYTDTSGREWLYTNDSDGFHTWKRKDGSRSTSPPHDFYKKKAADKAAGGGGVPPSRTPESSPPPSPPPEPAAAAAGGGSRPTRPMRASDLVTHSALAGTGHHHLIRPRGPSYEKLSF